MRALALAWTAGWELCRLLPEGFVHGAADVVARGLARRSAGRETPLRATLRRVVGNGPQLDAAVRDAWRSYARYWVESFRAADLSPTELDARTTTTGFEHLDAALERGRGVVVLLAHHGSWDVAAQWAETHGYHLAVVAEVLRPRALFERFVRLRESVGLEVVPLRRREASGREGGTTLVGALRRTLAANHMVGLLSDRDLSGTAPVVTLFGEPARMPRGPAVLAQRTGAAVIPITMLQRPQRRWHLQVLPEVDVTGLTVDEAVQRMAGAIEDLVRLDPAQWHCFSPVHLVDQAPRPTPAGAVPGTSR